jgi:hypothetical protein
MLQKSERVQLHLQLTSQVFNAMNNFLSAGNFRAFQLARGGMHQKQGIMADRGGAPTF